MACDNGREIELILEAISELYWYFRYVISRPE